MAENYIEPKLEGSIGDPIDPINPSWGGGIINPTSTFYLPDGSGVMLDQSGNITGP